MENGKIPDVVSQVLFEIETDSENASEQLIDYYECCSEEKKVLLT